MCVRGCEREIFLGAGTGGDLGREGGEDVPEMPESLSVVRTEVEEDDEPAPPPPALISLENLVNIPVKAKMTSIHNFHIFIR